MVHQALTIEAVGVLAALGEIPLRYTDKHQALQRLTALTQQALGSTACSLTLVDLPNRCALLVGCVGFDEEFRDRMASRRLRLGSPEDHDSLDIALVSDGAVVERYNLQTAGQGVANPYVARKYGLASLLAYPLTSGGKVLGYLNHFSASTEAFTDIERRLLESFARQAVTIIEAFSHSRLAELNEVLREMAAAQDDDRLLLDVILDGALRLLNANRGWVSRLDLKTGRLNIVADRGDLVKRSPLELGQGITGKALLQEKTIRVDDIREHPWTEIYEKFWDDTRSEIAVPILIENAQVRSRAEILLAAKLIGVINIESTTPGFFTESDETYLTSLARHGANILERIEEDRKFRNLSDVKNKIAGNRDWNAIIRDLLKAITNTLGFEYVNLSLIDFERNRIRTEYVRGIGGREVDHFKRMADHSLDSQDIQADIVRSRKIEVPEQNDPRFDVNIFRRFGHHRLIRVFMPMIVASDNRVIGTVEAGYQRKYHKYIYERDVQFLKSFVDYAAEAIEQRKRGLLDRIGHELTSPIVGIRNNASFLQRRFSQLSEEKIQLKCSDILADCEMLLHQVKQLEYVLGGEPPPSRAEGVLVYRDIIVKTVLQVKSQLHRDAQITYEYQNIPKIYTDKARLNQVVFNLVMNAIKYAKDPRSFQMHISSIEDENCFVIKFQDWGIGVEVGLEERIFGEGFRTPEAIRKNVAGSGLGLTIARRIMREMGGDLLLSHNSQPTEFRVLLPRKLQEKPDDSFR